MIPYALMDVFTDRPYAGNPLAVVADAGALTAAQMQAMAREFNLSETIFIRPPADPRHAASVRIFLPDAEIPFAGHPTIGCAIHLARAARGDGDWDMTITLEEQAGLVPVRVWQQGGVTRGELVAPVLPRPQGPALPPDLVAAALGLAPGQIGLPGLAPGIWAGGPAFAMIPLDDRAALAAARPRAPHWAALAALAPIVGAYLYAPGADCDWQARMFAPGAGVAEDPATGSATAILAGPLAAAGRLARGDTRLTLRQGVEMGRPSDLTLTTVMDQGGLTQVRVAGAAVTLARGQITPPPA